MAALPPLPRPVVSRLPLGLLGFLGIKNGGQAPQQLIEAVAPTFELLDWYTIMNANTFVVAFNNTPTPAGPQVLNPAVSNDPLYPVAAASLQIPIGEGLIIPRLDLHWTMAAAGAGNYANGVLSSRDGVVATNLVGYSVHPAAAAAAAVTGYQTLLRPLILRGGDFLVFATQGNTGITSWGASYSYVRFPL